MKKNNRILDYYDISSQWLNIKYKEKRAFSSFFEKNGYHTIAIYGMGDFGQYLYEELKDSSITVAYAIDKNAPAIPTKDSVLPIKRITEITDEVDAIIVTPTFAFDAIKRDLQKQGISCPIISLLYFIYNI